MKLEKIHTVEIRSDFENNDGDPINISLKKYDNLNDAKKYYEEQSKIEDVKNGVITILTLYEGTEDDLFEKELVMTSRDSQDLPKNGVIVYYRHVKYMNYAYSITNIETVEYSGKTTRSNLPYSYDSTSATWATVFDDVNDLAECFERGYCTPFDKLNHGIKITKEFLAEQKHPDYIEDEDEDE